MTTIQPKFPLGVILMTANATQHLNPAAIDAALRRHAAGDWGDICPDDARENERSLKHGCRLMSVYGTGEQRFWIITEADRSLTTVLLPLDY